MKRALRVFAAIVACLVGEVGFALLLSFVGEYAPEWLGPFLQGIFLGGTVLMPALFIYYRHKRRDLWVKEEAERWIANHSAQRVSPINTWHRRVRRTMLWIPSLMALSVFLFLPETMGIVSHLFIPWSINLNQHRLHMPLTTFVRAYGNQYASALIGKGIVRVGPLPYWRKEPPFSSLFFYAIVDPLNDRYDEFLRTDKILSKQTLAFGNEVLTCWDVIPNSKTLESESIAIECLASKNDLHAWFYGSREDEDMFYEILKNSTLKP